MAEARGLIGKKLGMTQVFAEDGSIVPVTVIEAGPCRIIQIKTKDKDGYDALQLGYGAKKESRTSKQLLGHFKSAGSGPYRLLREFRVSDPSSFEVGAEVKVDVLEAGARVHVKGTSIGKGFVGVVKRHGFSGGPKTHGSKSHDVPGSIGGSAYPSRVWPGQKLPGRTGGASVTIRSVSVVGVDADRNLVWLKGAVPGKRNSYVTLETVPGTGSKTVKSGGVKETEKDAGKGKKS
jgi:large subunit ribosomal protein L3